jgi:HEAT repeat protein
MADITTVVAQLGNHQNQLSYRDLRQLSDLGRDAQPAFLSAWEQIDGERRRQIAQALVDVAEDNVELDFRDAFVAMLNDPNSEVRRIAATGLWEDERLSTLRTLLPMLTDDPEPDVRAAVALTLARFAHRCGLEEVPARDAAALRAALLGTATNFDLPADVRRRALEGAAYFEGEDVLTAIAQAYATGQRLLKESALVAMGHSLDPRWLPILEAELRSSEGALRYEAARASGELGEQAASLLPELFPLTESDDPEVAQAAIWALGQIGGEAARRTLRRLARSKDTATQEAAQEALAELDLDSGPMTF